jgi:hypothetical protein
MLRIANPGSDIDGFIRIFRTLFDVLKDRQPFDLDDMSSAMVKNNLATSCGFMGEKALELSTRADRSRDPLYNQSKMYSELYRTLGWIHPLPNDRLRFTFTFLGAHVVEAERDPDALMRECLLGIAFPNEVLDAKGDAKLRPFACILRTMGALGGLLCRDEMIIGPLSLGDDRSATDFDGMVARLRGLRGDAKRLQRELDALGRSRHISQTTMENYTRFPIAVLVWAGWATKQRRSDVYASPVRFLELTEAGHGTLASIGSMADVRAADLAPLPADVGDAVSRLAAYQMLGRAGFDLEPVSSVLMEAETKCKIARASFLRPGVDLLFSPFQELSPSAADRCFPRVGKMTVTTSAGPSPAGAAVKSMPVRVAATESPVTLRPRASSGVGRAVGRSVVADELLAVLRHAKNDPIVATEVLAKKYVGANQGDFYPLVAELFTVAGVPCTASRAGVNYQRSDAMMVDATQSIPVEIKSPGEELFLSVKAVRQAAENKIILLARKAHPTRPETTSLAVGFNLPNDRSEVSSLIQDLYDAFRIRVGVIDFRSLVRMALASATGAGVIDRMELAALHGIIELRNA